jgi:hypothetical protein
MNNQIRAATGIHQAIGSRGSPVNSAQRAHARTLTTDSKRGNYIASCCCDNDNHLGAHHHVIRHAHSVVTRCARGLIDPPPSMDSSARSPPGPQPRTLVPFKTPSEPEFQRLTPPSNPSSYKRPRGDDDDAATSVSHRSGTSTNFSSSGRDRLQSEYKACSVCNVTFLLHACHVFDKASTTDFETYRKRGLVNLKYLSEYENSIRLCVADHSAYDSASPLLVIVPKYLDYFIEFEKKWQEKMRDMDAPSTRPLAPASAASHAYAEYCRRQSGDLHTGALYVALPLADYKIEGTVQEKSEFVWHGDPWAVLWHARKFVGQAISPRLSDDYHREVLRIRGMLYKLVDLYDEGDRELSKRLLKISSDPSRRPNHDGNPGPGAGPGADAGAGPGAGAGAGAGADAGADAGAGQGSGNDQFFQMPSTREPDMKDQCTFRSPLPDVLSWLSATPPYLDEDGSRHERAELSEGVAYADTLSGLDRDNEQSPKRQRIVGFPARRTQQPRRWGGFASSTEDDAYNWDCQFGTFNAR